MVGVHDACSGDGKSGRRPSHHAGLGRVGVHDVRAQPPQQPGDPGEGDGVVPGVHRATQLRDPQDVHAAAVRVQIVLLVFPHLACDEHVLHPRGLLQGLRQTRDLHRRTPDVHARDDAGDPHVRCPKSTSSTATTAPPMLMSCSSATESGMLAPRFCTSWLR